MARVLGEHAPASARCLRSPASGDEIEAAQERMGVVFPADLVEWFLFADGLEPKVGVGALLPPMHLPPSAARTVDLWQRRLEDSPVVDPVSENRSAGSAIQGFDRLFVPVGDDTTGDLFVADLRPGEMRGCVLNWGQVDGHAGAPIWSSVTQMWADVAQALETSALAGDCPDKDPHLTSNGCAAVFSESGVLEWEF
ncbi:SMI1/KNR4 family protein [Streptomyces sp. UH6]|nr:SMI1/KNR4 family protein [Streptomyces sp. UH6]NYV75266.1 SMI1/KNR4 family protein [Streptomyces sp. UH6]